MMLAQNHCREDQETLTSPQYSSYPWLTQKAKSLSTTTILEHMTSIDVEDEEVSEGSEHVPYPSKAS